MYFEKQMAQYCGVHAVNNAIGERVLRPEDMPELAEAVVAANIAREQEADRPYNVDAVKRDVMDT